jgi:hypothetical protein
MTVDQMEAELKANHWKQFEKHDRALFWINPQGLVYPTIQFAWKTMKEQQATTE